MHMFMCMHTVYVMCMCPQVAAQLDCWLGALPAAPREAREIGAGALGAIHEQLRVAMLHARYGL
jgi:hypothetical protein